MEWTPEVGCAYGVTFTIAAAGATMVVDCQLTDYAGNALKCKNAVHCYYSTDDNGDTVETLGATTVLATDGIILNITDKILELWITEDDGTFGMTLDGDGASAYLNVILPNGKVVTSSVIAFSS